uniref:E3 ubiquitin-protein ligase UBR4 N-terminal domain-containing protein n=2 Tax=Lutzomyia longipalpis TaxID=7200 RepID=A0A1B0CK11_LUTLO
MAHGIDFGIKPFLSSNYTSLSQNDITNLVKAIIKYEYDIIEHDDVYDQFFTSMAALAADGISAQCNSICHSQMDQVTEAMSILMRFLLNRLENSSTTECKILLGPLKSLCEGKSTLNVLDTTVLLAMLKNAKQPETTKSPPPNSDKDSPKSEMKRSRSDLSCVIMQQLTTPLMSGTYTWTPLNEEQKDCSQIFIKANIACLQALNAGNVILNVCTSLPILSRYRIKYEESALQGKNLYLPLTHSEATTIKNTLPQMSADILILYTALSIPAIEPLTPNKIIQLSQCAMSALYCAVLSSIYGSVLSLPSTSSGKSGPQQQQQSQPASSSGQAQKDNTDGESSDYHAAVVVNKALEIFVKIGTIFKNSTRSHIYHNHFCMGAWLLITGIQGAMGASGSGGQITEEKGKSPSKSAEATLPQIPSPRVNLFKVQQGFGVLNDAIATLCLVCSLNSLMTSKLNHRVIRVLTSATLQQMLTFLATVSYRKACALRRASTKNPNDDEPISFSDSTTYFNETFVCSQDSETEEEDSESYLGLWFKETLSPEGNEEQTEAAAQDAGNENGSEQQQQQQGSDADGDDLNVEHTQLLLFLFHTLNLMQKKSILLLTAGGVIRCAEVCRCITPDKPLRDGQIMLLSRLLLFLEYLMKHLYNPPANVLEQVRWNLFSVVTLEAAQKVDVLNNRAKLISFRKDIEDKYKKLAPEVSASTGVRPKFYTITPWELKLQQEFKMDGLAWNFILFKYHLLIDALIDILSVTDICTGKVPFQTLCAVQYCFSLSCIQPVSHSHYLIVNSLVKQGMYTQFAEILWNKVTEHAADVRSRMNQTIIGLDLFAKNFQSASPRLSKVILIDALLSHLYAVYWAESNSKMKVENNASSSGATTTTPTSTSVVVTSPESLTAGAVGGMSESEAASGKHHSCLGNVTRDEMVGTLRLKLLDVIDILLDFLHKTTVKSLCGQIPIQLMESLISITSSKTAFCSDITNHFLSVLTGQDKDVVNIIWTMELTLSTEGNLSQNINQPVEMHTLGVIDAHLTEISKYSIYSILMSLKHTLKSALKVLSYLLPLNKCDQLLQKRLENMLIPLIFDIRTMYLYETANECLEILLGEDYTSDSYQFLAYSCILKHTYKLVIDYCELSAGGTTEMNLDETILHYVFKFWESMLDKQMGMKAMHEFFYESKRGSLVSILLSFSNTNMSQVYSTKVLQFFEKLFQASERPEAQFNLNELCQSIAELGTCDPAKLKTWLSHILLGPGGGVTNAGMSSNNSSNVQTPTNVATASAVANIAEQIVQTSNDNVEVVDMEIDDECVGASGGGGATSGWQQGASITTNRSETPNEECLEKNGRLLQTLTKYIVSETRLSPSVSGVLFNALIQIAQNLLCPAQDALEFTDLLQVMVTLADAGHGKGHAVLFSAAIEWLEVSKNHVLEKSLNKLTAKSGVALENVSSLLQYMSDLLQGLGSTGSRAFSPPWEEDNPPDMDDFIDDVGADDEDSVVEDSDEDSL